MRFVVTLGATLVRGVVLQQLWRWFVAVPFGVMALSIGHAIGLSILCQLLTFGWTWADVEANDGKEWHNLLLSFCISCFALASGLLFSFLM